MLEARPGAFIFIGKGDSPPATTRPIDFNDDILGHGASYWVRLIETAMPAA